MTDEVDENAGETETYEKPDLAAPHLSNSPLSKVILNLPSRTSPTFCQDAISSIKTLDSYLDDSLKSTTSQPDMLMIGRVLHEIRAVREILEIPIEIDENLDDTQNQRLFLLGEGVAQEELQLVRRMSSTVTEALKPPPRTIRTRISGSSEAEDGLRVYGVLERPRLFFEAWRSRNVSPLLEELDRLVPQPTEDIVLHIPFEAASAINDFKKRRDEEAKKERDRPVQTGEGVVEKLEKLEAQARASVDNIRRSSGEAAAERQSFAFGRGAETESRRSSAWSYLVFIFVGSAILIPLITISFDSAFGDSGFDPVAALFKAAIALPLLGAAAYCARISAQHRESARHMNLLSVQIDTVASFVEQLKDEESRTEILMLLGRRAFSDAELTVKDEGKISAVPVEAIPLFEKAMDVAKEVVTKSQDPR